MILSAVEQARGLISELEQGRFFGSLEVKFEAGRIVLLRKTETIKPIECRDTRGKQNGQRYPE